MGLGAHYSHYDYQRAANDPVSSDTGGIVLESSYQFNRFLSLGSWISNAVTLTLVSTGSYELAFYELIVGFTFILGNKAYAGLAISPGYGWWFGRQGTLLTLGVGLCIKGFSFLYYPTWIRGSPFPEGFGHKFEVRYSLSIAPRIGDNEQ